MAGAVQMEISFFQELVSLWTQNCNRIIKILLKLESWINRNGREEVHTQRWDGGNPTQQLWPPVPARMHVQGTLEEELNVSCLLQYQQVQQHWPYGKSEMVKIDRLLLHQMSWLFVWNIWKTVSVTVIQNKMPHIIQLKLPSTNYRRVWFSISMMKRVRNCMRCCMLILRYWIKCSTCFWDRPHMLSVQRWRVASQRR